MSIWPRPLTFIFSAYPKAHMLIILTLTFDLYIHSLPEGSRAYLTLTFIFTTYLKAHMYIWPWPVTFIFKIVSPWPLTCIFPAYLKAHMRSHTDKREFVCSVCGARFNWPAALRAHTARKHGTGEDIICPTCGQTFKTREDFAWHNRKHQVLTVKSVTGM